MIFDDELIALLAGQQDKASARSTEAIQSYYKIIMNLFFLSIGDHFFLNPNDNDTRDVIKKLFTEAFEDKQTLDLSRILNKFGSYHGVKSISEYFDGLVDSYNQNYLKEKLEFLNEEEVNRVDEYLSVFVKDAKEGIPAFLETMINKTEKAQADLLRMRLEQTVNNPAPAPIPQQNNISTGNGETVNLGGKLSQNPQK